MSELHLLSWLGLKTAARRQRLSKLRHPVQLHVYTSFEPPLIDRVLQLWNGLVPRFRAIEVHRPEALSWGLSSDVAADELRVFLLDRVGVGRALDGGLARVLLPGSAGRAPLVALLPDEDGMPDEAALIASRAMLFDAMGAAEGAGVKSVLDSESRELAGIPYTDDAMLAFGTAIFRSASALLAPARKVIAVDCDGTLWQGLCAEDGPRGVRIGKEERDLQEFLLAKKRAGWLLALVSKNVHEDVAAVFRDGTPMPLAWHDIAATRIGWGDKATAIRQLAVELNLGLDSFVFLDDSPAECAVVRGACVEVAVLKRPPEGVARFLGAAWPFDAQLGGVAPALAENRTKQYQDEALRRAALREAPSFAEHVQSLGVQTTVRIAGAADEPRIFELSQRTNQFHSAADKPSFADVSTRIKEGRIAAVEVVDRFGEYGLSGAVFFTRAGETLRVERWLLSCRVLGRGVEEDVFDAIVGIARREGCRTLEISCTATRRNRPVCTFLASVGEQLSVPSLESGVERRSWSYEISALGRCPRLLLRTSNDVEEEAARSRQATPDWTYATDLTADIGAVAAVLGIARTAEPLACGSETADILQIASEVLGRAVCRGDNLYALGADSLRLVRLLARLKSRLGLELPMGEVLHRANVDDLLALAEASHASSLPVDDGFWNQVQSLYEDEAEAS